MPAARYPGSRATLEKHLAEAHQEIRDAKNEAFAAREALSRAEDDRVAALAEAERQRGRLSDVDLFALAALVSSEGRPSTPAVTKLEYELRLRRVIK